MRIWSIASSVFVCVLFQEELSSVHCSQKYAEYANFCQTNNEATRSDQTKKETESLANDTVQWIKQKPKENAVNLSSNVLPQRMNLIMRPTSNDLLIDTYQYHIGDVAPCFRRIRATHQPGHYHFNSRFSQENMKIYVIIRMMHAQTSIQRQSSRQIKRREHCNCLSKR